MNRDESEKYISVLVIMVIRLYTQHAISQQLELYLTAENAHYLKNVMRRKVGDTINIFNEYSGEWVSCISYLEKKSCVVLPTIRVKPPECCDECAAEGISASCAGFDTHRLRCVKQSSTPACSHSITTVNGAVSYHADDNFARKITMCCPRLTLVCSFVKNPSPSFIVQKASELGVDVVQPTLFQRSIVDRVNLDKLRKVAIEATEQCGRLSVATICDIISFDGLIARIVSGCKSGRKICVVVGALEKDVNTVDSCAGISTNLYSAVMDVYDEIEQQRLYSGEGCTRVQDLNCCDEIYAVIGPEGGFCDDELLSIVRAGRITKYGELLGDDECSEKLRTVYVKIGTFTLRTETAIIALLTICKVLLGRTKVCYGCGDVRQDAKKHTVSDTKLAGTTKTRMHTESHANVTIRTAK